MFDEQSQMEFAVGYNSYMRNQSVTEADCPHSTEAFRSEWINGLNNARSDFERGLRRVWNGQWQNI